MCLSTSCMRSKLLFVLYPIQCNLSKFLTMLNLNFHRFQLKLAISNGWIQQTSVHNKAPRDALKYCWVYVLKTPKQNKTTQKQLALFELSQSRSRHQRSSNIYTVSYGTRLQQPPSAAKPCHQGFGTAWWSQWDSSCPSHYCWLWGIQNTACLEPDFITIKTHL